jgi:prolyl 4-hydroxylase
VRAAAADRCRLGELCPVGAGRPLLEDGGKSHPVWDLPRFHMKSRFQEVRRVYPSIEVNYLWTDPVVVYFDGALSDKDIDVMLKIATPRFSPSTIVQPDGSSRPDPSRTSDTAWLDFFGHDRAVAPIVTKLVSMAGFHSKNAESMGVNRYRESQYFRLHYDWMEEEGVQSDPMFPDDCQRAATVLAYLSDTEEGGETVFVRDENYDFVTPITNDNPDMLVVKPKKGRVLIWFDMHPYRELVDRRTLHGGQPVIKGEKVSSCGAACAVRFWASPLRYVQTLTVSSVSFSCSL